MKSGRRGNLYRGAWMTCEIASPPDFAGVDSP
jgi:hypothetical protein